MLDESISIVWFEKQKQPKINGKSSWNDTKCFAFQQKCQHWFRIEKKNRYNVSKKNPTVTLAAITSMVDIAEEEKNEY